MDELKSQDQATPKPRVLLVDDCIDTLAVLRHLFETAGASVFTAGSGTEALSFMDKDSPGMSAQNFNLIVLDIRMPHMPGDELARKIREVGYSGRIVALTATASGKGREESKKAGIDIYLGKAALKKEVAKSLVMEAAAGLS